MSATTGARTEAALNRYEQFTTELDGLPIHFLQVRSPQDDALPLVMTHGWPGSIIEFSKVIGPLTDPAAHGGDPADAFHLVCPSLPGYGFSGKPAAPGWNVERIASAWAQLMARLGYSRYGAQGGDWGAAVTMALAGVDAEHLAGIHVNMALADPQALGGLGELTEGEQASARVLRPLHRMGLRLLHPAVHPAPDRGLRAGRLSGRAVRVDRGEVLVLDGLRRRTPRTCSPATSCSTT